MNKTIIAVIITAIVAGGIGFFGGMKYAGSNQRPNFGGNAANFRGNRMINGSTSANRSNSFGSGVIIAKDDKSITVKMQDGGSKIIFFSGSTKIDKSVAGSLSDLEIGKNVSAIGSANQDGSFTAESIQIRSAQ